MPMPMLPGDTMIVGGCLR